jgi:hypothetical protein
MNYCCRSPQKEFAVRHDGHPPLANDALTTITLPEGLITRDGLGKIREYLVGLARVMPYRSEESYQLQVMAVTLEDTLGNQWQTPQGNYAKRLGSHAYKTRQVKLAPEVLAHVGSIARDHSKPVDVAIAVTRQLNQPSVNFGNPGSCWWSNYSYSRCALKTNGGFGLRAFTEMAVAAAPSLRNPLGRDKHEQAVSGRAWVMPLRRRMTGSRQLVPTFETVTPDAFVVFNGYGSLKDYAAPRVMAHLAGWTYRKIEFSCDPMYVNPGGSYLVAPEELTEAYAGGWALRLSVLQHSALFDDEHPAARREARSAAAKKAAATRKARAAEAALRAAEAALQAGATAP